MKKAGMLVCFLLVAFFSIIGFSPPARAEARFPVFGEESIKRIVNGAEQDLIGILDTRSIVVFTNGMSATDMETLEKSFRLKKVGPLFDRPDYIVFDFIKPPSSVRDALSRWNALLSRAPFSSLVFRFPGGRFALSGEVVIQWKKFLPKEGIQKVLASAHLKIVSVDDATNTTVVRVTEESGKNPFLWAIMFDPENQQQASFARVEFVRLMEPIRAESEVVAGCMRGMNSAVRIAAPFCYRVTFYRAPNIRVSTDDLSINTKLVRSWLPEGVPSELRRFNGDRAVYTEVEKLPSGEVLDVVEYKLQMLRSGAFVLPPLRFYYDITGDLETNRKRLEGQTNEVLLVVWPEAHPGQSTVNDIPNVVIPPRSLIRGWISDVPWWIGFGSIGLGVLLVFLGVRGMRKKRSADAVMSSKEQAYQLWLSQKSSVGSMNDKDHLWLLKSLIGVYYFGDRFDGRVASAHSGNWQERLGAYLTSEACARTHMFVRAIEEGRRPDMDIAEVIGSVFGWDVLP